MWVVQALGSRLVRIGLTLAVALSLSACGTRQGQEPVPSSDTMAKDSVHIQLVTWSPQFQSSLRYGLRLTIPNQYELISGNLIYEILDRGANSGNNPYVLWLGTAKSHGFKEYTGIDCGVKPTFVGATGIGPVISCPVSHNLVRFSLLPLSGGVDSLKDARKGTFSTFGWTNGYFYWRTGNASWVLDTVRRSLARKMNLKGVWFQDYESGNLYILRGKVLYHVDGYHLTRIGIVQTQPAQLAAMGPGLTVWTLRRHSVNEQSAFGRSINRIAGQGKVLSVGAGYVVMLVGSNLDVALAARVRYRIPHVSRILSVIGPYVVFRTTSGIEELLIDTSSLNAIRVPPLRKT